MIPSIHKEATLSQQQQTIAFLAQATGKLQQQNRDLRNGGGKNDGDSSPKTKPPSAKHKPIEVVDGVKHFVKQFNGKDYHWCAKCGKGGRWSPTHWTKEHTGTSKRGQRKNQDKHQDKHAKNDKNGQANMFNLDDIDLDSLDCYKLNSPMTPEIF